MATIKAYTDIEQSRKLAEILPLESADMYWKNGVSDKYIQCFTPFVTDDYRSNVDYNCDVPCWSLAALLSVLPGIHLKKYIYRDGTTVYYVTSLECGQFNSSSYDNPVDACYEIILKLHKLNEL